MKKLQSNSKMIFSILLLSIILVSSCEKETLNPENKNPIVLDASFFDKEQTLSHTEGKTVDYTISELINLEKPLIINDGTIIEFGADAGFNVEQTGSINIQGTRSSRAVLTGKSKTNGYWRGILFNTNSSQNKLHFVDIDYAGSTSFNSNGDQASVIVWGDAKLSVLSSSITSSGANGISAVYSNSKLTISDTKITSCKEVPLVLNVDYIESLDGSNDFEGNNKDYINLKINLSGEIEEDVTLYKENIPYRLSPYNNSFSNLVVSKGTLTIEAGVTFLFEESTGLYVKETGALKAIGTATNKIIFEGVNKDKGSWKGIYFRSTQSTQNMIKHASVYYAGADFNGLNGGVLMAIDPKVTLDNIEFNNIDGCAVFNDDTQDNPNLTSSNLTESNTNGLICHE